MDQRKFRSMFIHSAEQVIMETHPFPFEVYNILTTCSRIPYATKLKYLVQYIKSTFPISYFPHSLFLPREQHEWLCQRDIGQTIPIPLEKTYLITLCHPPLQYRKMMHLLIHLLNEYLLWFSMCAGTNLVYIAHRFRGATRVASYLKVLWTNIVYQLYSS